MFGESLNHLSRRGFLQRALAGTAAAGLPLWYGRELVAAEDEKKAQARKAVAPGDRIVIGCIGIGSPKSRGSAIMGLAKGKKGVEIAAVCDVDKSHVERAAKQVGGDCKKYDDFRQLLDNKDLSAVIIATPDQWHTLVAIDALRKGKDVYCEKPLTLTVAEGQALVKVAKETGKVFQTGSQQRSEMRGMFRLAAELIRNGRLGKVSRIECRIGSNPKGTFKTAPVPEGLNWDFWLGPCPKVEYVPERCHYEYRWWYEYSGGKMTDWGAHHLDIAQWALDRDGSGPVAVEATGVAPSKEPNSYNCHPNFTVTYTYPGDVKVLAVSKATKQFTPKGDGGEGIVFEGEGGKWLFVSRGKIEASEPAILDKLGDDARRLYPSTDHMGNWVDCIRSRKATTCPAEVGHSSATVCHIGVIALRTGKKLKWDPEKQQFDDAEANRWLSREMRAPWKLEA
jgi:myo-inositol 2-dehydrogenase / D-chiro-inositol 1-dehydrogenase